MEEENIINLVQQVQELIQTIETYKETAEKSQEIIQRAMKSLSVEIQKRPQAEFSESEIKKIKEAISSTRMAAPDLIDQAEKFSEITAEKTAERLSNRVVVHVKQEHTHNHNHFSMIGQFASNETNRRVMRILVSFIIILSLMIGGGFYAYMTSWVHWGYRLERVCQDPRQNIEKLKGRTDAFIISRNAFKKGKKEREEFKHIVRINEQELKDSAQ